MFVFFLFVYFLALNEGLQIAILCGNKLALSPSMRFLPSFHEASRCLELGECGVWEVGASFCIVICGGCVLAWGFLLILLWTLVSKLYRHSAVRLPANSRRRKVAVVAGWPTVFRHLFGVCCSSSDNIQRHGVILSVLAASNIPPPPTEAHAARSPPLLPLLNSLPSQVYWPWAPEFWDPPFINETANETINADDQISDW